MYDGLSDGGFACAFLSQNKDTFLTKARWSKKVRMPLLATFDPYDEAQTSAWLDSFAKLTESGPHGHLYCGTAGVFEFDFVSGEIGEWLSVLKDKVDDLLDDLSADDYSEEDQSLFQTQLAASLHTSMAYSSTMLKEEVANEWAKSFMNSMDGGKFFRSDIGSCMTASTFDTMYVAAVGTKVAYILIQDED